MAAGGVLKVTCEPCLPAYEVTGPDPKKGLPKHDRWRCLQAPHHPLFIAWDGFYDRLLSAGPVTRVRAQAKAETPAFTIADTWQGTLHAGRDLRTVVKITKDDGGGYKAVFYSIDQGVTASR